MDRLEILFQLRRRGIRQKQVAEDLNITQSMVSQWFGNPQKKSRRLQKYIERLLAKKQAA